MLALIYEVIWQRQFALLFGSAASATSAVLSAYFAGLGLGAWWVGKRASGWRRPLRAYAFLELFIALGVLLVGPFLHVFESAYPTIFHLLRGRAELLLLFRLIAAGLVLILPTFCMGGTLPLVGPLADRGQRRLGVTAGWLYFVNTAGAALGALLVPFLLLPRFGLSHSVWGCAGINLAIACGAWFLDTREKQIEIPSSQPAQPDKLRRKKKPIEAKVISVTWLAFVSGFVTFALQILWNRAFA